jgi:hypothetical protein
MGSEILLVTGPRFARASFMALSRVARASLRQAVRSAPFVSPQAFYAASYSDFVVFTDALYSLALMRLPESLDMSAAIAAAPANARLTAVAMSSFAGLLNVVMIVPFVDIDGGRNRPGAARFGTLIETQHSYRNV